MWGRPGEIGMIFWSEVQDAGREHPQKPTGDVLVQGVIYGF